MLVALCNVECVSLHNRYTSLFCVVLGRFISDMTLKIAITFVMSSLSCDMRETLFREFEK